MRAIGAGLRDLHDGLPARTCPFEWSTTSRPAALSPAARLRLGEPPPVDRLVVCHGDACAPNTLIDYDGRRCGHVDFGDSAWPTAGPISRWRRSRLLELSRPGVGGGVLTAYGAEPDPARIDYRRLWQASDSTSASTSR